MLRSAVENTDDALAGTPKRRMGPAASRCQRGSRNPTPIGDSAAATAVVTTAPSSPG